VAAFPDDGAHWRRGEVGEGIEEIESYSEVVFSRSGAAGRGVGGGAARPAVVASCGGSAPAWEEGRGQAGKVYWTTRKLSWGSIWVEEGGAGGSAASGRPAAALSAAAAPGGDGDGRGLAVELHRGEEVPFRGSIGTEGHRR
jgi:hypothetical protein